MFRIKYYFISLLVVLYLAAVEVTPVHSLFMGGHSHHQGHAQGVSTLCLLLCTAAAAHVSSTPWTPATLQRYGRLPYAAFHSLVQSALPYRYGRAPPAFPFSA